MKFLIAPIIDTFYIKKVGKRKTYILGTLFLRSILLMFASLKMDLWIENLEINKIAIISVIENTLMMFLESSL